MVTDQLVAAVDEVLKKLAHTTITEEKCMKIIAKVIGKPVVTDEQMTEILSNARNKLREAVMKGVEEVIQNDGIAESLIGLKKLIEESSKESKGWRPTGVPENDIAGHMQAVLMTFEEHICELKQKLEAEVERKRVIFKESEKHVQDMIQKTDCNRFSFFNETR